MSTTDHQDHDILGKLKRLLAVTPEFAHSAPPMSRRTLAAAIEEIAHLRGRVADLATERALLGELIADAVVTAQNQADLAQDLIAIIASQKAGKKVDP